MDLNNLPVDPLSILGSGLAFLAVFLFLYKRRIIFVFDILCVQALTQAAACTMALFWIDDGWMKLQFFASQAAFTGGFLMVRRPAPPERAVSWNPARTTDLELTTFLVFVIVLLANVWMGATAGFPLFANDPSVAKVDLYSGGLGLVKRIDEAPMLFLGASSLLLALHSPRKWLFRAIFAVTIVFGVLGGSKGSLLTTVYFFVYLMGRRYLLSDKLIRLFKYGCGLFLAAGTLLSLFILRGDQNSWIASFQALAFRVLFYGDIILYYYQPAVHQFFSHHAPLDFIPYALNPILGELRLVAYQKPLGFQMVNYTLNAGDELASILGPNTTFFVVGRIFFGPVLGVAYCAFVGFAFAKVRSMFLTVQTSDPGRLAALLTMAVMIATLAVEVPLFTSNFFDTVLFVGGCYIAAKILLLACSEDATAVEASLRLQE